jgi:RNA polymerase sigma-70 factor (ECF subfamily)
VDEEEMAGKAARDEREARDLAPTVAAARRGDPAAFEKLVLRFRGPLTAYAYSLLRDRGHAEDAVQEALVLAHRDLGALREPGKFRQWLYAIVENTALTGYRRLRRRPTLPLGEEEAVAEGASFGGGGGDPGEPLSYRAEAVRASMAGLRHHYAEALRLHYVDGLSSREMAGVLGLSQNNAKMRLRRARKALRRDLEARGVEAAS